MNNKDFDRWLKDSLEDHASAIPVGGWKSLHSSRKKQKRRFLWWYALAAMLVFGSGIMATYFITLEETPAIAETKAPSEETELRSEPFKGSTSSPQVAAKGRTQDKAGSRYLSGEVKDEVKTKVEQKKFVETSALSSSVIPHAGPIPTKHHEAMTALGLTSIPMGFYWNPDSLLGTVRVRKLWVQDEAIPSESQTKMSILAPAFVRWNFYLEPGFGGSALRAESSNGAKLHDNYLSLVNGSNLTLWNYSIALGVNLRYNRYFQFQGAMRYQYSQVSGTMDYQNPVLQNEVDPLNIINQSWHGNRQLQQNNYTIQPNLKSHSLQVPLGFQFTPQGYRGFYIGANLLPTVNLSTKGEWVSADSLEPETFQETRSSFRLGAEFNLGYSLNLANHNFRVQYRFSPWYSALKPPSACLGGNAHGFSIQWQMP